MSQKAVFLDRDDTLIHDPGYISKPEQVKLVSGAAHALWQLKKMGFLVIIVSNQSGIARGLITPEQLEEVHRRLNDLLASEGVYPDGIYHCPYHPEGTVAPFNCDSDLRKPKPGMLLLAAREKAIDLSQSWMIGDSYRDIEAGRAAGCHTILVDVPGKPRIKQADEPEPERKAVNLREAVNIIRMFEFHQKVQKVKSTGHEKQEINAEPESVSLASHLAPEPQNLMHPKKEPKPEIKAAETAVVVPPPPAQSPPTAAKQPAAEPQRAKPQDEPAAKPKETPPPTPVETAGPAEPPIRHAHTFKKAAEPAETSATDTSDKTPHLLEEILQRLRNADRQDLYHEFSVFKLIAMMLQMLSVFCLIASVGYWLSAKAGYERVFLMLGYTIALQLLVIALMMMHSRD
jgi:D-glycero-D-manno-heptose 1,7-bisphosphate phosphatase